MLPSTASLTVPSKTGFQLYSHLRTITKLFSLIFLASFIQGCATSRTVTNEGTDASVLENGTSTQLSSSDHIDNQSDASLVATDLVSAMMQLEEYPPWSTTVQISPSSSEFGESLVAAFLAGGYGIQKVSADQGTNYVSYRRSVVESDLGQTLRYTLSIKNTRIYRDYQHSNKQLHPSSVMTIAGSQPRNVKLNDDLYRQRGGEIVFPSGVVFEQSDGTFKVFNKRAVKVNPNSKRAQADQFSHQRFLLVAKSNTLLSNRLENTLDIRHWEPVRQVTLAFPSKDPDFLGNANKRAIKKLLADFDHQSQGISITGCAHNQSLLWDGTESDSLDRQRRVLDELLVAGVPVERLRENGCFKSEFSEDLPKQSVIVTIKQQSNFY